MNTLQAFQETANGNDSTISKNNELV